MKLTMNQAMAIKNILGKIADANLPIKTSYKIMKIVSIIEVEEKFFNQKLAALIEKYGEKNDNGEYVYVDDSNIKIVEDLRVDCEKEIKELQDLEIEIPDYKFTLIDFNEANFTPREVFMLEPFLDIEI